MAIQPPEIRFDAFVLDQAGRRLLREQVPLALEPKAFDVLALLAGAPGRAFTRDEILDAVWGHRHVTPGVLNRIMTLLRHALGEDAHSPRYLHTLHGVGYRFDLPRLEAATPMRPAMPAPPSDVDAPVEPTAGTPVFAGADRRRGSGAAHAPVPAPARASRATIGLVLVLAAVLAAWAWQRHAVSAPGSTPAQAVAQAPRIPATAADATAPEPALIVMPLEPIGDDPSTRDLAAGLSDELITELARVRGLRVIARESTSLATADTRGIAAMVPRLGISHALEGSLARGGEHLRVRLRLTDLRDGRTLWAQDYDRAATDALQLQRDVARAVASALALNLGLGFGDDAHARGNADFLRRYFAARKLLHAALPRRTAASRVIESQFRALVREQPNDGRSHAGLAAALELRAFYTPEAAAGMRQEAAREADVALRLDPNLADALLVQAAAACRRDDWERCLRLCERAQSLSPGESRPQFNYGMVLAELGYLDRALDVMRTGADSDPLNDGWRFGQARILDTQGRHREALAILPATSRSYARWFNAVWRGDLDEALRVANGFDAQPGGQDPYESILRPSYLAVSLALKDPAQWPLARQRMRENEQRTGLPNLLRVMDPGAQPAQIIAGLEEVRHRSYSTWDLLLWTRDLVALRRDPAFADYLRRTGILAYWQRNGYPAQCRPAGTGAVCD